MRIVIQCATPPEFEALRQAAGGPAVQRAGKRQFFEAARGPLVVRGAVGKVWAAASAEFAIGRWEPQLVVDFGAAGALVKELGVGDLVVAEKVIEHDFGAAEGGLPWIAAALGSTLSEVRGTWLDSVPSYPQFHAQAGGSRATRGRLAAGDKDVQTFEERARLAADVSAIAATWESSAIGRVCKFHGVPYVSIRVITDVGGEVGGDEFLAEYKKGVARALGPAAQAVMGLFMSNS